MSWGNSASHWGFISRLLHWFMAIAIIFMFGLGVTMINTRLSPIKLEMFMVHKSIGILILAMVTLRIIWRLMNSAPRPSPSIKKTQRRIALAGQLLMYVLMVCIPISGWVINSAANFPLQWFGLFEIPPITQPSLDTEVFAKTAHLVLVCTLATMVVIHITAALHHHFIQKNDVLRRMF
jgi:cytochrome b561|tara:strand:+ start:600 stop:1136 length:537 start_codon:yes stop_codon:yes gene_type:complete